MSGYRRFIAYVYEYQKGKKSGNCGFIKVEIRNQRCRMELHLHCPGIPAQTECKTYGILRKDGLMNGILLGQCRTSADTAECIIETDSLNIADSGIAFDQTGGVVILTETGGFFGTEWDDQPVRPDNFREIHPGPESVPAAYAPVHDAVDTEIHDETHCKPPEISPADEVPVQPEIPAQILSAESVEITDDVPVPETAVPSPETENIETEAGTAEAETTETKVTETKSCIAGSEAENSEPEGTNTEFTPFDDLEFIHCQKIQPGDLGRISPRIRALQNNRFLQYGYYNFGHLLLAQRQGGRFILGVPGGYDQQERFMAGMFGFPYFKECRRIRLPGSRGGYWYRLIDAPDSH